MLNRLIYCQKTKGWEIYAWYLPRAVQAGILTSHVHLIIGTSGNKVEDILRDIKSFTSESLRTAIQENPTKSRKEWLLWLMKRAGKKQ